MVLSRLQLARSLPSGENATPSTDPSCPLSLRTSASPPWSSVGIASVNNRVLNWRAWFMAVHRSGIHQNPAYARDGILANSATERCHDTCRTLLVEGAS